MNMMKELRGDTHRLYWHLESEILYLLLIGMEHTAPLLLRVHIQPIEIIRSVNIRFVMIVAPLFT